MPLPDTLPDTLAAADALPAPQPAGGGAAAAAIDLAVIIPAYRQPGFLAEALDAVLAQRGPARIAAVVVDDGCPFPQTGEIGLAFARRHPDRVFYLRRRNGGLSAARNTGIDFALRAFPACSALYPLDCDNRLHPDFLDRARAALLAAPPEVGWVYPDFDFFGLPQNWSAAGAYSRFLHLLENSCEAGSLIRRAVFATGLRYDEAMRAGFEDWDLWLRAGQQGFRGQHLPMAGFQYRKRAESMLAGSERQRGAILGGMRARYGQAMALPRLLQLEARELPRFALHLLGSGQVEFGLDPEQPPTDHAPLDTAWRRLVESQRHPAARHFPRYSVFATPEALEAASRAGLLRNLLYQAMLLLRQADLVAVLPQRDAEGGLALEALPAPPPDPAAAGLAAQATILILPSSLLLEVAQDPQRHWIESILRADAAPRVAGLALCLPQAPRPAPPIAPFLFQRLERLRAVAGSRSALAAEWRPEWRRPRATALDAYHELTGCGAVLPHLPAGDGRDIGFLLPLYAFGGVEKVVFNYAATLRARGWRPHLFITGARRIQPQDGLHRVFESLNFFEAGGLEGEDEERHLGAPLSGFARWKDIRDAVGLLATMDVVVNTHAMGGHGLMQALRRLGLRTWLGLHLVEKGPLDAPLGNPHIALAYEAVYDGLLVISDRLRDWCIGQAVPAAKVTRVLNAPSYAADPAVLAAALRRRALPAAAAPSPLRVLFLGRLDAQKGLERLYAMILQTRQPDIAWRLVGKAVLHDTSLDLSRSGIPVEPPAMTGAALDALYDWADVVVLPSRFEGVPLTILEAQRFGCVVLATDVGAVAEIVADGVDGFTIPGDLPEAALVGRFVARLRQLATDRALLQRIGQAAAARLARSGWEETMRDWILQLENRERDAA